jgi:hypothetical protein
VTKKITTPLLGGGGNYVTKKLHLSGLLLSPISKYAVDLLPLEQFGHLLHGSCHVVESGGK